MGFSHLQVNSLRVTLKKLKSTEAGLKPALLDNQLANCSPIQRLRPPLIHGIRAPFQFIQIHFFGLGGQHYDGYEANKNVET